ncbi:MAG: aminotransferase class V-fold PLP-dependent enzyme [Candidatus Heimdallarchaeota archaeon]|nr:aminotransferase class V-fold PLP-dependent enzyme [Candidatus Heimdallarchaeota archaeon]
MVDWAHVREDFPTLSRKIDGKSIIYLDSACMALKPKQVIDASNYYYTNLGACGGRSIHTLARETTELRDAAREKISKHISSHSTNEIIWVRNTTEAMNLVAHGLHFEKGQEIITTNLEHHSGVLPFHKVMKQKKLKLKIIEADETGLFDIEDFEEAITRKTRLISIVHTSNVSGTTAPLEEIIKIAHDNDSLVVSDDAQYFPHRKVDVRKTDVDFCTVSMHKALGPTGVGFLYGKEHLLKEMDSFLVGGDTIKDVKYINGEIIPEYLDPPHKFEAGLQNYAGEIASGAAVDYLNSIGMENIEKREEYITEKLFNALKDIPEINIVGPKNAKDRHSLVAFKFENIDTANDIANFLDSDVEGYKLMIRAGAHCTNPFHYSLGIKPSEGTARASTYIYNNEEEITILKESLENLERLVRG